MHTMNLGDLARLRSCITGCELVVLADISTNTVLAWDGALRLPQEHLDSLCDLAAEVFSGETGQEADTAVLTRPTGYRTFVRAPGEPAEVLCAVLSTSADPQQAVEASAAFFQPGGRGGAATVH